MGSVSRTASNASLIPPSGAYQAAAPAPKRQRLRREIPIIPSGRYAGLQTNAQLYSKARPVVEEDQAGKGVVHSQPDADRPVIFIKSRERTGSDKVSKLKTTSHPNIVNLSSFREEANVLSMTYEITEISLADVAASPSPPFTEGEIACFCKEILQGMLYVHQELRVGIELSAHNIMLNESGGVKIANVGELLLTGASVLQRDIQTFGAMVLELLAPGHTRLPTDLWSRKLQDFIDATARAQCAELLKHDFLRTAVLPCNLVAHIYVAKRSFNKHWKLCFAKN